MTSEKQYKDQKAQICFMRKQMLFTGVLTIEVGRLLSQLTSISEPSGNICAKI